MSTTTTSYVDFTDTQMIDYAADTDFSMLGSTSSPGWLTVEATMSDATSPAADAVIEEHHETIEIDMEPHGEDEEMREYEMMGEDMDAMRNDAVEDLELVDIEVIDRSRAVSPAPAVAPAPIPASVDTFAPVVDPILTERAGESITAEPTHEPEAATTVENYAALDTGSTHDYQHTQAQPQLPFSVVAEGTPLPPSVVDTVPIIEGTPELVRAEVLASGVAPEATEVSSTEFNADAPEPEVFANGSHAAREDTEAPVTHGSEEPVPQYEGTAAPYENAGPVHNESAAIYDASAIHTHAEEAHDIEDPHEGTEVGEYEERATNGEDPHEISDGVYIDPPPAVLLTVLASGRQIECSLFNQPHVSSGSHSPTGYASTSTAGDLSLLLHQRPTLYYEPLSHVFDALREEEAVYSLADFVDGELVLDAYDLDLRVLEVSYLPIDSISLLTDLAG